MVNSNYPASAGFFRSTPMTEKTSPPTHEITDTDDPRVVILPVVMIVMTPEDYAAMIAESPLTEVPDGEVC